MSFKEAAVKFRHKILFTRKIDVLTLDDIRSMVEVLLQLDNKNFLNIKKDMKESGIKT